MSVTGKLWKLLNEDNSDPLFRRLLNVRGISDDKSIDAFLHDTVTLHDPMKFRDMKKAVKRIEEAIHNQEKIIIFGDYDVDGISGSAILVYALERLGANVSYRLPHRVNDGYGLTTEFVEEFRKIGVSLVITVDCGISCKTQIDLAKSYGIDIIVTDHHTVPKEIPLSAHALLHPLVGENKYEFPHLSGSGMAFKLACALFKSHLHADEYEKVVDELCDLACLGTIADLVPLQGENRVIVKRGLRGIYAGRWPGIKAILDTGKIEVSPYDWDADIIGYGIGPRLNAAGRIDEPYIALQTLLGKKDPEKFAKKLEALNEKRKEMTYKALEEVQEIVKKLPSQRKIIIIDSKNWHTGIVGLLAGKLVEQYRKPVIVMDDRGDTLVASARSPEVFSIIDALTSCGDLLESFGGHRQAAGFTVKKEKLPELITKLEHLAEEGLSMTQMKQVLEIDTFADLNELDWGAYEKIKSMSPFGVGNTKPKFLLKNIEVRNVYKIGGDKQHLRFDAFEGGADSTRGLQVIGFNMGQYSKDLYDGRKVDLVVNLDHNTWNGDTFLQLRLVDFKI